MSFARPLYAVAQRRHGVVRLDLPDDRRCCDIVTPDEHVWRVDGRPTARRFRIPEREGHLDLDPHRDWLSVLRSGLEPPIRKCLQRLHVQARMQRRDDWPSPTVPSARTTHSSVIDTFDVCEPVPPSVDSGLTFLSTTGAVTPSPELVDLQLSGVRRGAAPKPAASAIATVDLSMSYSLSGDNRQIGSRQWQLIRQSAMQRSRAICESASWQLQSPATV